MKYGVNVPPSVVKRSLLAYFGVSVFVFAMGFVKPKGQRPQLLRFVRFR